ncbi:helix-turn-helix domain-containing protein [Pseudomonas syringae]|uniref:helix-turn-helix domain-containing protein n=1 Tax=Pseudomonas syringae TaxID=317 RepID=UPI001F07F6D5|nr:helix-turn-helix transcriptional regulator [Pseudomonas syringae]
MKRKDVAKICQCKYKSGNILTLSEEIGARLREQRNESGLTQDQLAVRLGVSKRTVGNYESGTSDAPAAYLSTVARELGFDVMYILNGVRTTLGSGDLSEVEDVMIRQYRTIPEHDQHAIRRFLKAMADDVKAPTR